MLAGLAALVLVLAAAAFWTWRGAGRIRADGPIVLISIDTLRADRLPAYGYTRARTPRIDALAADGVLFENAYAHSPQTLPSHASMFSGRLPFEHGVRDNIGFTVRDGERLLQHALKERGYATGGFVSAYVLRHQTGIGQGFDVYDDELPAASPDRPLGQVQRGGSETVAAAVRWVDQQGSPRFMLFLHIYEPHKPYTPPARFTAADPYDGEVEYSDEIVGRLIEHLRAKGLYDAATIVLLSDHGEGLGDHGEDEHGIFLYRETIRVPLVVKLPGSRGAGRRVAAPVQHIDVPVTLADLAGAAPLPDTRGRSLRGVLDGSAELAAAGLYAESLAPRYHFGWSELYALTDERYRLIRAPRDEIYDVSRDPGELASIAPGRPQLHAAMRKTLDALIAGAPVSAPSAVSEEDRRKLAALGYVGAAGGVSAGAGEDLPDPKDKIGVLRTYKRATELAGAGRLAEAAAAYRQLLRDEPEMIDAWLQLADVLRQRGQHAEMVAAYQEVVHRSPTTAAALIGIAGGLLRLSRFDEARAHAELAAGLAPAAAHELLARIAIEQGDPDRARREARLASGADPTLPAPAFIEGLILYRQERYADALPHLLEARGALDRRTEQVPDVRYLAGDAAARLERYAEAERLFLAELAAFPGHVRARAGLAMLYRATGRPADADRAVEELVRRAPTREGHDLAAQLWTMFGQPARAAAARAAAERLPR